MNGMNLHIVNERWTYNCAIQFSFEILIIYSETNLCQGSHYSREIEQFKVHREKNAHLKHDRIHLTQENGQEFVAVSHFVQCSKTMYKKALLQLLEDTESCLFVNFVLFVKLFLIPNLALIGPVSHFFMSWWVCLCALPPPVLSASVEYCSKMVSTTSTFFYKIGLMQTMKAKI